MMKFLSAKGQLTFGLLSMQASILCAAMLFGFVPERDTVIAEARANLCETIAVVSSQYISTNQPGELTLLLSEMVKRNHDVASAGIRRIDGRLLQEIGEHQSEWDRNGDRSSAHEVIVPINAGATRWGNVELRFTANAQAGLVGWLQHPWLRMSFFISSISAVLFYLFLRKMLRHLDPTNAVPQRVRAALDSLAEGLIVVDRKGQIVLANQAFSDWVQRPPQKLTGVRASDFEWVIVSSDGTPESLACRPWTDAIERGAPQAGVMMNLVQAGQPTRTLMANASPVLGHDGKYSGVLVSFDDVTQLEDTRKHLEVAREVAEHANSAKSEFLARMSHEIRTPMNAILGYTEVLRNGFDEKVDDRISYLDTIHGSGEHLLALINDILDLSKIEAGQMDLDMQQHGLREMISQVTSAMVLQADEKRIALRFEAVTAIPETIRTDAVRFRQALFNLVGNAVKFTSVGEVRIAARMDGHRLSIDVIDTGIGIPEDALGRVFERFSQADASTTAQFGGTGLGLAICRELAEKMGGDVTAVSVPGSGSTFTLSVDPGSLDGVRMLEPGQEGAVSARPDQIGNFRLPGIRVLIVDDEKANRNLVGIYLERAGGTHLAATNGQQAIEIASQEEFDVILMDFNMPVMGGLEATRILRDNGCDVPVIALTANVMEDDEDDALEAGCNGFLRKPIRMVELLSGIRRVLGISENLAVDECKVANRSFEILDTVSQSFGNPMSHNTASHSLHSSLPTDDAEICEIVLGFIPRLQNRVQQMRECLETRQFTQLREHAHWLAGAGETVGFADFTEPAQQLEEAAGHESLETSRGLVASIEGFAGRIVEPALPV